MSFYGGVFRLTGWLFAVLLIAGQTTIHDDGSVSGGSRILGVVMLAYWLFTLYSDATRGGYDAY